MNNTVVNVNYAAKSWICSFLQVESGKFHNSVFVDPCYLENEPQPYSTFHTNICSS